MSFCPVCSNCIKPKSPISCVSHNDMNTVYANLTSGGECWIDLDDSFDVISIDSTYHNCNDLKLYFKNLNFEAALRSVASPQDFWISVEYLTYLEFDTGNISSKVSHTIHFTNEGDFMTLIIALMQENIGNLSFCINNLSIFPYALL